jgi:hypothetical protein
MVGDCDDPPQPPDASRAHMIAPMTLAEYKATLSASIPPDISPLLRALWHDANGNWDEAHRLAQDVDDKAGAWVHAYLHRKEGDLSNASYWYRQAGKPVAADSVDEEWNRIATELLSSLG